MNRLVSKMIGKRTMVVAVAALTTLLVAACSGAEPGSQPISDEPSDLATTTDDVPGRYALQQSLDFTITLTTTSVGGTFGRLDRNHTCERGDTSPHLRWEGVPEDAQSLALVMEDPASDVLGFSVDVLWAHWVLYSIPASVTELTPGQSVGEVLENGAKQGANDFKKVQYNGPCPIPTLSFLGRSFTSQVGIGPAGQSEAAEDRPYYFRLYALDIPVDLQSGVDRDTLMMEIDGHVLASGELAVSYKSTKKQTCQTTNPEVCLESVRR